ncbi:MAG: Rpn family recombination-promoting nuclease/putative transposase [Saprospiraceae bacterium]|jgi:predicted transposase/invertase (TIGR01784 family)|nr:Rpn family recombination-promoting nuclease/putative transposase [Saprospiraceae bacterium]
MSDSSRPLISFDWAIKRLLRQKANYDVLEGFLSELLHREMKIINIPESEANAAEEYSKINKVDILCESSDKELILIELQYNSELDYMHRMLYGSSKLIVDYLEKGDPYDKVRKIYSINIVYFDLGQGDDYIYKGTTEFKGIHTRDILQINAGQKKAFNIEHISAIYPEYYIIKVNRFNDLSRDSLDDWIYYFKHNAVPENSKARGLNKVAHLLKIDQMDTTTKYEYEAYIKDRVISRSMLETAKFEGREEGLEEGLEKGREEGMKANIITIVIEMKKEGLEVPFISKITKLTENQVIKILMENGF